MVDPGFPRWTPTNAVADPGFSPDGDANSQKSIIFLIFCWKLHENERIWTSGGGGAFLAPPLRSANAMGANQLFGLICAENCMKMTRLDWGRLASLKPHWSVAASSCKLRVMNLWTYLFITELFLIFRFIEWCSSGVVDKEENRCSRFTHELPGHGERSWEWQHRWEERYICRKFFIIFKIY